MIADKQIEEIQLNAELLKLRDRIISLENEHSHFADNFKKIKSPEINLLNFISTDAPSKKSYIPAAFTYSLSSMLLIGGLNTILLTIFSIESLALLTIVNVIFVGMFVGIYSFISGRKIEEFRLAAQQELIKNEVTGGRIRDAQNELESQVEKRTTQVWETNSFLKKEILRRRKAEEGIKNYNNELLVHKRLLEDKNSELNKLNSELQKSEINLKELNESKDKFFSILAHDLRSPFASIIGLADFLNIELQHLNSDEIKKIVRSISHSSKRVHMLLENLLKWSLVQTGRLRIDPVPFNIENVITEVVELLMPTSEIKSVSLETEIGHNVLVHADKNMIETVVRNLVSNAVKFSNRDEKIIIKTVQQNQFVRVDVIDNGIGISEEDMTKIFKIEEHTNVAGTGNEKGTGLGLILCKEFVERNGGKIWFNSALNKGSEFYFTIPSSKENFKALYENSIK